MDHNATPILSVVLYVIGNSNILLTWTDTFKTKKNTFFYFFYNIA